MMILLSLVLAHSGFATLALAMDRHHRQVRTGSPPPARRRALTALGWLALTASLAPCVATWGWGAGITGWAGCLTAAAGAVLLQLSYAPRSLVPLAGAAAPVALLLVLTVPS